MEELLELHDALAEGRYDDALTLVDEMTAMAKKDIIDRIGSFIRILLIHLIKSHAEKRMTHSWATSIAFALDEIKRNNQRECAQSWYMDTDSLRAVIDERFPLALRKASTEAFEGKYSPREFATLVDDETVKTQALEYILHGYPETDDDH